jgi:N6-adenosine-specific RNA methylase IME4
MEMTKAEKRAAREKALGEKQLAMPDKRYGCIYADPPWRFEPRSRETGLDRDASNHYPVMTLDAIKAMAAQINGIAAPDCALFLWATVPMLPQAIAVMDAWGFLYKSNRVWTKAHIGLGFWFRSQHEHLLLGTRGNVPAPAMGTQPRSVIHTVGMLRRHSEKPAQFRDDIVAMFPTLPRIELFARERVDGWDAWGNEV